MNGLAFVSAAESDARPGCRLWAQVCANFITPQAPKLAAKDRKVAVVGLTRILTESTLMLQEPSEQVWCVTHITRHRLFGTYPIYRPAVFTALVHLFREPKDLAPDAVDQDPDAGLTTIDFEEQAAGYQAAYSRLAAAESMPEDPAAHVSDVRSFVGRELARTSAAEPKFNELMRAADSSVVGPFVQAMAAAGYYMQG